ncbi:MAG: hypothetical protein AB7N61_19650 [Acidimicrobiia bacterium]
MVLAAGMLVMTSSCSTRIGGPENDYIAGFAVAVGYQDKLDEVWGWLCTDLKRDFTQHGGDQLHNLSVGISGTSMNRAPYPLEYSEDGQTIRMMVDRNVPGDTVAAPTTSVWVVDLKLEGDRWLVCGAHEATSDELLHADELCRTATDINYPCRALPQSQHDSRQNS